MVAETATENLLSRFLDENVNIHDVLVNIIQIPACEHMVTSSLNEQAANGVLRVGNEVIQFSLRPDETEVLIADIESRALNCLSKSGADTKWIRDGDVDHSGIMDLDANGTRWEGGVSSSSLFGYGKLYNESDRLIFEGFMRGNQKVCYGTLFYEDIAIPCYCGCFFNNQKCGKGYVVDRLGEQGDADYWNNNNRLGPKFKGGKTTVHSHIKSLTLNNSHEGLNTFDLGFEWMRNLESLVIVRNCFKKVRHFRLENLPALRMLLVNPGCFHLHKDSYKVPAQPDGEFIIRGCPQMTKITIGPYCFADYSAMIISDLPSLEVLTFQYYSFHNAHQFIIKNFPSLKVLEVGHSCFKNTWEVIIDDLPKLEKLSLNSLALEGDKADDRKRIQAVPYHYTNTLRIASVRFSLLPFRSSFSQGVPVGEQVSAILRICFPGEWDLLSLCIEDIPSAFTEHVAFDNRAFEFVTKIDVSNVGDLKEKLLLNSHLDGPIPWTTNQRYFLTNEETYTHIPEDVETLISKAYFGDWTQSFELPFLPTLKTLTIGSFNGVNASKFILKGLPCLETITMGQESFGKDLQVTSPDREFRVVECPKLRSIELGYRCFSDYSVCELRDLPSLQSIKLGYWCFTTLPVFELRNLPSLERFMTDSSVMSDVKKVVIEDLPKLKDLLIGYGTFYGCNQDGWDYSQNEFILRNLPSLTQFYGGGCNCYYTGKVILDHLPSLKEDGFSFADNCFKRVVVAEGDNEPLVEFARHPPYSFVCLAKRTPMIQLIEHTRDAKM